MAKVFHENEPTLSCITTVGSLATSSQLNARDGINIWCGNTLSI